MNRAPLNPILDPDHHQPDQCDVITRLHPLAGNWPAPPEERLARLIKCALRAFGQRCIRCEPAPAAREEESKQ